MKLICTQENLNKGLSLVANIANKNTNLPILNNVLLRAEKDGLFLITTDLEIGIKVFVRGKIEKTGTFTVEAKLLNNLISLSSKDNINIELADGLKIKSKNQETIIKGLDADDFPLIPEIEKDNKIEISCAALKKSLSQVIFAASSDPSRIEINAVNFSFKKGELILAATDSYRLAEKKIKITNDKKEFDLIIPLKTLQELSRILSDHNEGNLEIYFNENQILFAFDGVELISRVIDGKYPDYSQIIPADFNTSCLCDVSELVPAIKSVSLFCKQGINDVRLSFDAQKKELVIESASSGSGASTAKIKGEINGQDNNIVFNYRYLLDGLNQLNSSEVTLKINNNYSPGLLQSKNEKDYLYLVMPIRQ
ncbi:MAG: DNA polymerase III subunit beta [Patescibacteria group bacterium]|nr:DNA polymerase III subunit beta [Patescibacteria group bacterium]